jgi:vancomycin resistance protein YoaR
MAAVDPTDQFAGESPEETESPFVVLRWPWYWRLVGALGVLALVLYGSFQLAYVGKIYPGVSADGVYLGGLTKQQAVSRLADRVSDFSGHALPISYGDTILRIPVNSLQLSYDTNRAIDMAYNYGRQGSTTQHLAEQVRALGGRTSNVAAFTYADDQLAPYLAQVSDDVSTPVVDATLAFNGSKSQVIPAQVGKRLDAGLMVRRLEDQLARTSTDTVPAPIYHINPAIESDVLAKAVAQADTYLAGPVVITYQDVTKQIDQATIVSWLNVQQPPVRDFMVTHDLADLYPPTAKANIGLDESAVTKYLANLAQKVNQTPQNAILSMDNGKLTVTKPGQDGVTLDQPASVTAVLAALKRPATDRTVALTLKVVKPDVNGDNLDSLGIKELISEGETFFPGSTADRLTNVRVGAARFNGVLLKPGETFSFGALLGDVGPAQGYKPELVILADHEEKQYGGGLCQVSSTAFRAALNAGLPILERHNHSFAISYYTAPYGVPGVDATIYYPQIDFKFKNDTGSYMLIQTIMQGNTLKFQYYGTKTKSGVINAPTFVSGTTDATQPSHTVFTRDVLDLAGKVTKTDTFDTYYKSSTEFPVQKQFN